MKAYRIVEWGRAPEFEEVTKPTPGPGEVVLRMKGAGLCRSDLDMMAGPPYSDWLSAGYTLGHENAGIIDACGQGVTGVREGDAVVVHHMQVCGYCDYCLNGVEQSCTTNSRGPLPITRGCGIDGGLAPYLVVPRKEVLSIGALDPVKVAPLTDAGVTAYRAVKSVEERLTAGTNALVIGIGGLGAFGVQFLKILSQARIFAVDVAPARLQHAHTRGADHAILSDDRAAEQIMDLTGGRGCEAIIDFVGSDATLALAARVSRPQGRIVLVGMELGTLSVGWGTMATSCEFAISLGSKRADLREVCDLAARDLLHIDIERFAFDEVETAYEHLRTGKLTGRAVVTFD
ncbi:NAD(P)-dependent alcohol dehydrogenase [Sphingomonas profundi]|uniref:NAD(P)-dependent alcohol dehydrogenase n=1 Tax=Alterirhizorhabdus profundi TaxID=2681549 RepID=UPI0012E8352C|nr:NAD(P)-dependent alcohol dehydrogenase [Sphingomonas profundi]